MVRTGEYIHRFDMRNHRHLQQSSVACHLGLFAGDPSRAPASRTLPEGACSTDSRMCMLSRLFSSDSALLRAECASHSATAVQLGLASLECWYTRNRAAAPALTQTSQDHATQLISPRTYAASGAHGGHVHDRAPFGQSVRVQRCQGSRGGADERAPGGVPCAPHAARGVL